jgi:hypothetical protein
MLQAHGQREGYDVSHTVSGYPWEKLGKATVIDVSNAKLPSTYITSN